MWNRVFLNRYRAVRLLGEGGMGRAYLARQLDNERLVVVKVLHEKYAGTPHYRESFRREIDLLSRFRHPGAVELYEASMTDPQGPCLVMEYVQGESPDALLQRHGRLEPARVGRLLGSLCSVLQAAHAQGIIHRDLKPANILVVDADKPSERVKVLDFGLGRLTMPSAHGLFIPLDKFTGGFRANSTVGTPEYTCPETLRGDALDHRGDLYSVGVILYELLTGHLPFEGGTIKDILAGHALQPPPPFAQWGPGNEVPQAVEAVVRSCLEKDPAARPQSAAELAKRYGEASGQPIWDESDPAQASAPISDSQPAPVEEAEDPHVVVYQLEAWMPEQIAAVKLRGFLDAAGGEAIESVPGLIRFRLKWRRVEVAPAPVRGHWSWLGLAPKASVEWEWAHMDIVLEKPAGDTSSRLLLTVRLRTEESTPLEAATQWHDWCDRLHRDLKAYLMAQK